MFFEPFGLRWQLLFHWHYESGHRASCFSAVGNTPYLSLSAMVWSMALAHPAEEQL